MPCPYQYGRFAAVGTSEPRGPDRIDNIEVGVRPNAID
jgi:hypothetical protein